MEPWAETVALPLAVMVVAATAAARSLVPTRAQVLPLSAKTATEEPTPTLALETEKAPAIMRTLEPLTASTTRLRPRVMVQASPMRASILLLAKTKAKLPAAFTVEPLPVWTAPAMAST